MASSGVPFFLAPEVRQAEGRVVERLAGEIETRQTARSQLLGAEAVTLDSAGRFMREQP